MCLVNGLKTGCAHQALMGWTKGIISENKIDGGMRTGGSSEAGFIYDSGRIFDWTTRCNSNPFVWLLFGLGKVPSTVPLWTALKSALLLWELRFDMGGWPWEMPGIHHCSVCLPGVSRQPKSRCYCLIQVNMKLQ